MHAESYSTCCFHLMDLWSCRESCRERRGEERDRQKNKVRRFLKRSSNIVHNALFLGHHSVTYQWQCSCFYNMTKVSAVHSFEIKWTSVPRLLSVLNALYCFDFVLKEMLTSSR